LIVVWLLNVGVFAITGAHQAAPPKPITRKVVSVADGDTITALLDNQQAPHQALTRPKATRHSARSPRKSWATRYRSQQRMQSAEVDSRLDLPFDRIKTVRDTT
jgi:hypothetical protein